MNTTEQTQKPRVYSYARFSTPEQSAGDSLRRQEALARAYAEKHGLVFDEQLRDEGVSSFRGKNRKSGQLGRFLDLIEKGKVTPGSVLFVEDIDRLSREETIDAWDTVVKGLIGKGVKIVTQSGEFDRQSVNNGGIWRLIAKIENAHDESRKKSERLSAVWKQKKLDAINSGKVLSTACPFWLRVVGEKGAERYEAIPEAAETIRNIFRWYAHDGLGRVALERKLNREATWTPEFKNKDKRALTNSWRSSYVRKILENRAVLGEFQPRSKKDGKRVAVGEPRADYFPRIIADDLFEAAQRRMEGNRGKGGRTGRVFNLFSNLAKCPYCDNGTRRNSMAFIDRGKSKKGGRYLVCDNYRRGVMDATTKKEVCSHHFAKLDEVQETVLNGLKALKPGQVLPDDNERDRACRALRERISSGEDKSVSLRGKITNGYVVLTEEPNPEGRVRVRQHIAKLENELKALDESLKADREKLKTEEQGRASFVAWQADLAKLKAAIADENASELRMRLQSHLKGFISKIEIYSDGFPHEFAEDEVIQRRPRALVYAKGATDATDEQYREQRIQWHMYVAKKDDFRAEMLKPLEGLNLDASLSYRRNERDFINDTMRRRMTTEGRFYRVHFKSGSVIDLVPEGSIASGWRRDESGTLNVVRPDLFELWKRYYKRKVGTEFKIPNENTSIVQPCPS